MERKKIERINYLALKAKGEKLNPEEAAEQKSLRAEYLAAVRANLTAQLDNTYIVDESGQEHKLEKKDLN